MSAKKSEIKVSINCRKCKTGIMTIVAKFDGVSEMKLDVEKGMLTVVGSADPVCVVAKLRKAGYFADITSVGPPTKPAEKKPESKPVELPPCCKQCQLIGVSHSISYDAPSCSIL